MRSEETDLSAEIRQRFSAETSAKKTLEVYGRAIADHRDRRRFDAVVCGYYGFGNLGDELVLHSILSRTEGLRVGVIGARGGGRIWRFDPIGVCRALRSSGLFIFGGGTLLQNATSNRSLSYYLWVLRAAAFFGRPVALFASGVGPIIGRGARERCALALRAADYAGLRDEGSLRLAVELAGDLPHFRLSADPALVPRQGGETKGLIGVFVRGEDASPRLSEALISALSIVAKMYGYRVCFASMNRKRDRGAARELKKRFGAGAELWESDSREELFDFISSCALVVSARLHALITAASFARPFVGICSDPKVGYFVKECALPPIFSVFPESKSLEKDFETALSEAVEHSGELSERIKVSVEKLYRRAEPDLLCALRLMK
jgi:polysaccharide pyruvyl transferase CsaB